MVGLVIISSRAEKLVQDACFSALATANVVFEVEKQMVCRL